MLKDLTLNPLVASARVLDSLGTIDERLLRCGISLRAFVQFCSSLMIAAPFGLAITDKKAPLVVAESKLQNARKRSRQKICEESWNEMVADGDWAQKFKRRDI